MIKFKCSNCSFEKDVLDKYLGKKVRCPKCRHPSRLGQQQTDAESNEPMVKFYCSNCGQKVAAYLRYAGRKTKCTKCSQSLLVPQTSQTTRIEEKYPEIAGKLPQTDSDQKDIPVDVASGKDNVSQKSFHKSTIKKLKLLKQAIAVLKRQLAGKLTGISTGILKSLIKIKAKVDAKSYLKVCSGICGKWLRILSGKKRILTIAAVILAAVIGLNRTIKFEADRFGIQRAEVLAANYLDLLSQAKVDKAYRLIGIELQKDISRQKLGEMAQFIKGRKPLELSRQSRCVSPDSGSHCFALSYKFPPAETGGDDRILCVVVESTAGKDVIQGTFASGGNGRYVEISSQRSRQISQWLRRNIILKVLYRLRFSVGAVMAYAVVAIVLLSVIITIAAMCIVYGKAGQPIWAVFVPVYNMWILAEIADMTGWMGVLLFISAFVPLLGGWICFVMILLLSIGIAESFGRSIGFAVGLALLPMIFYPILAFSKY